MRNALYLTRAVLVAMVGCASGEIVITDKVDENLQLTPATNVASEGLLEFGTTVFAENPTTLLDKGDFHGYEFNAKAGGIVSITMTAKVCGKPDTQLFLFGPEDGDGNRGVDLVHNDDDNESPCAIDSKISQFRLPVDGEYLIVATSFDQDGGGHYALRLTCDNGACVQPDAMTFQSSRISQADIDAGQFNADALFEIGDFLFETIYRVEDGMGNALSGAPAGTNPRPNFRAVHQGGFGAPEAQSCLTCHNVGGDDGGGDKAHNIFQIGDGVSPATGLARNPPVVLGLGLRQQIGIEMTTELQGQLAAAKAAAASGGSPVSKALSSKGVSFGSIVARPDGTVDASGVKGVDADLVVRPFGWKGREATLRRFVEGGFRVHFGMQTAPSIAKHCATPDPNTFGTGANCRDPDGDGVVDEITEGQLTAMAVYMGLRQTPVRVPPSTATARARAADGEALFASVGCTNCHVATMKLANPVHVEPADTTGGRGITLNLRTDMRDPHPAVNSDGSMTVEMWSDFQRHDMGTGLADSKPFKNIPPSHFITTPLWGVATSPPYMHDGRAKTLKDAILAHGGEAASVKTAYAALGSDDQQKVTEFLSTLGREEMIVTPPAGGLDLSGFTLRQTNASISFRLPAGTVVPHGGFVVVARNATKQQFESFYGTTLGANVVFVNGGSSFPQINGSETYALSDANGATLDGPSIAQPSGAGMNFTRVSGSVVANSTSAWVSRTASRTIATPGTGHASTGSDLVYISEISDATGTGNYVFEFIEIFVE